MRADDAVWAKAFSRLDLNERAGSDHPLRAIRGIADAAVKSPAEESTMASISPSSCAVGRRPRIDSGKAISVMLTIIIALGVAGCSALPTAGPTAWQIFDQATDAGSHFDIVNVDGGVVSMLRSQPPPSLRAQFTQHDKPPSPKIGIGDAVSVTIYESAAGGLFGGTIGGVAATGTVGTKTQNATIPEQVVDVDGSISVPYAGRVPAAGLTLLQVQETINKRLADRAIEPQAIVTVTKSVANTATVSGEGILTGSRIPLPVGGSRLLDVIAAAGGVKSPVYETHIRLSRGGVTATIPMTTLVSHPEENIYAWPGDVITLLREPQTFSVFGATTNNLQVPFGAGHLNLAEAIAKAGGLADARADPAGVFLFRFEPPPIAVAVKAPPSATASDGTAAILYHLDLRQADGYFLAERFPVRQDDLIYVANAPATELQKFLTLVATASGPALGAAALTTQGTSTSIGSTTVVTTTGH